jgi:hypothetical protein
MNFTFTYRGAAHLHIHSPNLASQTKIPARAAAPRSPITGVATAAGPLEEDVEAAPAVEPLLAADPVLVGPVSAAAPSSDASALVASGKSLAVVLASPHCTHTPVNAVPQSMSQVSNGNVQYFMT